jgi:GT2 family glycosyltransferase
MRKIFIGIPILNRLDLLTKCVAALDYPAEVVVVNNNACETKFNLRLDSMASERRFEVLHQDRNLGVSASWNLILMIGFRRGYDQIFIGSNDTFLHPGSLRVATDLPKSQEFGVWHLHAFNFFIVCRRAIETVGRFDENFYPAYKEDEDFSYRCELAGVRRAPSIPGCTADHIGSATIHSDPQLFSANERTHHLNTLYYIAKWGGDAGHEIFRHPYNNPSYDHRWWPTPGAH